MSKYTFRLTAVSPWFLNGADPRGQPELRAPSVRGQLRYWLRAVVGARTTNLKDVWEAESAIFGSTGQGSAVSVRVFGKTPEPTSVPMLPHRNEKRSPSDAIPTGYSATLELVTRPGIPLQQNALTALQIWSLLGGVGKRSRRMFGAVDIRSRDERMDWYDVPVGAEAWASTINTVLTKTIIVGKASRIPDFPTLHPEHSWVIVGRKTADELDVDYSDFRRNETLEPYQLFMLALFRNLLRNPHYKSLERNFGFAGLDDRDKEILRGLHGREKTQFRDSLIDRRASPIHAQLRRINGELYPVITAIRSEPMQIHSKASIDFLNVINNFMSDATQEFDAVTAWGGRFA